MNTKRSLTRSSFSASAALAAALLAGCTDQNAPLGVDDASVALGPGARASAAAMADVGGEWQWDRLEQLRMPRWFVEQVLNSLPGNDVEPEGPNTHARCELAGTMTLVQNGATFQGVAQVASASCATFGGQSFQQPGVGAPLAVFDGVVRGNAVAFSLGNPVVTPCPFHAVVSARDGQTATELRGGGRCVLPGHPHSGSIMASEPPPGGTSVALEFTARR